MRVRKKQVWKKRNGLLRLERRFVPWFSMAEWDLVYKQLYSDNTATQIKGFERLLLWKARCPQGIPTGAQCTVDIIQTCLKDREVWPRIANGLLPQYHEHELQCMYSLAILRFWNHFTPLVQFERHETMYETAKKLHIPDWIVNIRHDTAHGQNLPSLNILREAAHFCLDWIHEHYWKNEAEMTADLLLNGNATDSSNTVFSLKDIVEIWQAVMLYSKVGNLTYKDIPDEHLKKQLLDKRLNYDTKEIKQMKKELRAAGHTIEDSEIEEAQLIIVKEIINYLEMCDDSGEAYSHLVDILLEGDGFLASSDFMSVFNTEYDKWRLQNDSFPVHFINLWKTMLDFIQQDKMIPLLLKKLIALTNMENENGNRCRMAALWIKELALSLLKTKKAVELKRILLQDEVSLRRMQKLFSKGKSQGELTPYIIHKMIIDKVEDDNPDLKQVMTLKIQKYPSGLTEMELLDEAVKKPNKWTNIFLSCLMELVEPSLSEDRRDKLNTLVNIYTQDLLLPSNECNSADYPIYTVENLQNPVPIKKKETSTVEVMEIEVDEPYVGNAVATSAPTESIWILYNDAVNWSKCPLGRLPWQESGTLLNMDFPSETAWRPVEKIDNYEKIFPGIFHKKINWDEILWKRPRKNRTVQQHVTSVVEKAVSVALVENS